MIVFIIMYIIVLFFMMKADIGMQFVLDEFSSHLTYVISDVIFVYIECICIPSDAPMHHPSAQCPIFQLVLFCII